MKLSCEKIIVSVAVAALFVSMPVLAFHPTETSCDSCHIVHYGQGEDDMPLWSGKSIDPNISFLKYSSLSLDATPGEPKGSTLLCLACHDNSYGRHAMNTADGDLRGTHPIEFVYNTTLATTLDGELHDPASASSNIPDGGTIAEDLLSPTGEVKCVSCHDVHVQGLHDDSNPDLPTPGEGEDFGIPHLQNIIGVEYKLGRRGDPNSYGDYSFKYGALCLTCHIK